MSKSKEDEYSSTPEIEAPTGLRVVSLRKEDKRSYFMRNLDYLFGRNIINKNKYNDFSDEKHILTKNVEK